MKTAEQEAQKGISLLQEAVLAVLFDEHQHDASPLRQSDIRKRLGFPKPQYGCDFNAVIGYMLRYLAHNGYVDTEPSGHIRPGWRITPKGVDACKS